ncbi:MAG TPA: DNA replication/repair protein RecF [Ktedonosporobacter sp.]|jgi:DNA replication and repair protein RecF|nr:DNA replication/repair protein RecF [Ktedonosporobacter sp.]
MYLSRLSLSNFRNYRQLDLTLEPGLFFFCGDNAQGKTNLLEAVGMLATANSFHAANDREIVNWHAPDHIARLEGKVQRREGEVQLEIVIFDPTPPIIPNTPQTGRTFELPSNAPRKRLKVNGVPRKTMDLIGQMKVVLFAPTDLHLVDGPPDERRRFLDRALCQVQSRYCQTLVKYRKTVTQRSALLKRVRDNQDDPRMLDYLDELLTTQASLIIYERQRMIAALNKQADQFQTSISGGREHLQIVYHSSFKVDESWSVLEAPERYRTQLRELRRREIQQGVCLLGPHRDDLEFLVNGINILTYGSRGQQRTAALSAKLAELGYMRASTADEPLLLLDDVFSELDHRRREYLLCQVLKHEQVLLSATDLAGFPAETLKQAHLYQVVDGNISKA